MMKKFFKKISIYTMTAMLAFSTVPGTVQAHSGRTDSSGGHHDNKNVSGLGSYHYHCGGHPAHLHDGGVCPYSGSAATSDTSTTSEVSTTTSGGMGTFKFSGGAAGSGGGSFSGGAADVASTSQTTTTTPSASNAIQLNAGSSVTISKDIIRSKTNTHYSNAFEYNGYYYTTSAYSRNPGMNGVWVNNKAAVNMWKYLYEKNFEIPYD